ncbi:MAG: hypothetical protein ACKVX9_15095, partial [Blastocatellia bacterium]
MTTALVALAVIAFAVAPMQPVAAARQAVAQRISQSETAVRILSLAPASVRNAVGARLGMRRSMNASSLNSGVAMSGNTDVSLAMSVSVNAAGSAGGANVIAGRAVVSYDIDVTNSGPNTILAGELTLQIPGLSTLFADPNIEFSPTSGFGDYGGVGVCTLSQLAGAGCANTAGFGNPETRTLSFDILVGSHNQAGKQFTVNPLITANLPLVDTTAGNNAATDTRIVANTGILNLRKQATIISYPGGFITYTLGAQVTGSGWTPGDAGLPGAAYNSSMFENRVVDPMPAEIGEIISITPGAGWSCTPPPGLVNPPATTVQCDQNANQGLYPAAAGPYATVATIVVKTKLNLQDGQVVTNIATLSEDPVPAGIVTPSVDSDSASTLIRVAADLSIDKLPAAASAIAGGTSNAFASPGSGAPAGGTGDITYSLAIANAGPGDAENVSVIDNLPANTVLVSPPALDPASVTINGVAQPTFQMNCSATTAFSCVPGANTTINPNFVAGVLPNKFAGVIRYRVSVPSTVPQGTIIQNQASVNSSAPGNPTAQTPDPNAGNNVSLPTQVLVNATADLAITKITDNATPVAGGAAFSYTLTVTNNGPSDAKDVVVTDPLPQSVRFISVTPQANSGFSCTAPAQNTVGTVSCGNPSMATGASATITIVVQIDPNVSSGVRTNTAVVTSSTSDSVTGNNSQSVQIDIGTDADLTISKTGTPTSVVAGNNITYTINIENTGPSRALNVALTDTFPANTTFVSSNGTGILAGCSGGTSLSCPTSNLDAGATASLTIVLRVNPDAAAGVGALSNTANLAWTDTDADVDTAASTFTSDVTRSTDISISKDDSPDAVTAGRDIIYTIKVKNNGPSTAATGAVTVTDAAPANTADVSVSGTGVFSACNTPAALHAGCANAGGPMQPGEEATITYQVTVNASAPIGFITNIASVTAAEDGNNTNNQATRQTAVGPNADLQLTKTASPASVIAGDPGGIITYTISYTNSGPSDAQGVVISDTVAANLIPVGTITAAGLTCNGATATAGVQFTCSPTAGGVLTPGSSGTITYQVRVPANVPAGALITNLANIASTGASATPDPNTSNNTQAPTSTLVVANADLAITKTDSPDPAV